MPENKESFVIVGETSAGKRFRPSDWAERLCGVMAQYGPARRRAGPLAYSPYVMPENRAGTRCVAVDGRLHEIEAMAYRFLLNFAKENDLRVEVVTTVSEPVEITQVSTQASSPG
ncbi:MAG: DUF3579 domain-containing protein [Burkholderiaceae bacterium]